jgi:putative tryptophan/tyrosine transport system substrate-binding protein
MRRREFISGLGSAAAAWPLTARAQQAAKLVIGLLSPATRDQFLGRLGLGAAVHRGLSEAGYAEGRNLAIEYRFADHHLERLPAIADDLVRRDVAVILSAGTAAALAAKAATKSIPIVFTAAGDPIEIGLVASLNRPGGNVTGISFLLGATAQKRVELLHELIPATKLIGYLVNPADTVNVDAEAREFQAAARTLGVRLLIVNATSESEFEPSFAMLVREGVRGLLVGNQPLFYQNSDQLVALATRHRVPAIYAWREATRAGGLMSYDTDLIASYRLAGTYIGRILNGEKPGDLPVQQATRMELAINLKAAKALGIEFPTAQLVRADEVIE